MLSEWRTLTGVPAGQIGDRLAEPFDDPAAYKAIKGGSAGAAGLTDIETAWMVERLNEVFGPYGLGWRLDWDAADVVIGGDPKRPVVAVKRAEFTYLLVDEEGREKICSAPCTGGSQNELPYALKGMETSAIGNAVSRMRFQEDVYKGRLNHKNAARFLEDRGNGRSNGAELGPSPAISLEDYVVPLGKYRGKKLAQLDPEVIAWYAQEMKAMNAEAKELRQAARRLLKEQQPART